MNARRRRAGFPGGGGHQRRAKFERGAPRSPTCPATRKPTSVRFDIISMVVIGESRDARHHINALSADPA